MDIAFSTIISLSHRSMMPRLYTSFLPAIAVENPIFPQRICICAHALDVEIPLQSQEVMYLKAVLCRSPGWRTGWRSFSIGSSLDHQLLNLKRNPLMRGQFYPDGFLRAFALTDCASHAQLCIHLHRFCNTDRQCAELAVLLTRGASDAEILIHHSQKSG